MYFLPRYPVYLPGESEVNQKKTLATGMGFEHSTKTSGIKISKI
jgi:hypothetical protein